MRGRGHLRLWAPVVGVVGGCVVAGFFGLYDWTRVIEAPWVGIPTAGFGGWDLRFGPAFWALLPAFVFVTVVGAIETVGDAVAIQRVSWRNERAVDYRAVQGAVNADGLGNLLSGLLGTIPNTTYSTSVAVAELTGVGARVVGVYIGALFLAFAFLPKITALLLAIPGPVAGAYIMVLLSMLFVLGMKIVIQDGVDYKKGVIVGVSFWIGVGFQHQLIFADRLGEWWGALLGNGMTAGGLAAIVLSLALDLTGGRRVRMEAELNVETLPAIRTFLQDASRRAGWDNEATERLSAAAEETVLSLLDGAAGTKRVAAPATPLRLRGTPPAIPRRGHRDGAGGTRAGTARLKAPTKKRGNRTHRVWPRSVAPNSSGDRQSLNAGMMCLANISNWRSCSSHDIMPWSKNQPNHSSSPSPSCILCRASISRLT